MPPDNAEVVRVFFAAIESEDFAAALRLIDPGVEWLPTEGGRYRGLEGVTEAYAAWIEPWAEHRLETEEVIEVGDDQVLATIHIVARGRQSGIETDQRFFHLHTLKAGKISRMVEYIDRDEALVAAGAATD